MPTDVPSSPPLKCPSCGAVLPDHAPQGLCPRCLFAGLAGPTEDAPQSPASRPAPKPEELAPHFPQLEILESLGRGGMGIVYKARQKALDRFVALKLLDPERVSDSAFSERFAREAQALAKLNHPNIVTIHDFGEAGGFFYLLMEYVDGVNLRQAMKAGRFTPEQALAIVPPICDALQFAHERGIVHRDIKPENLLLDRDGRVMIADFGIAKMLGAESPIGLAESQPAGTPQYMAPEQRTVPGRVDHRADIYSLGVVFYEMLTGELPAGRIEAPSARMRGVQVDVRIDEIVLRALEKTPEMRYQTAGEFRTQVETVVAPSQHSGSSVSPDPARPAGTRFSRRAIIGVCWAGLFPVLAVSTRVVVHASLGPGGQGPMPTYAVWFLTAMKILLLVAMAAPLGTTILGWIAVGEIRRSSGKLHGLALAVFDGLLFPLGALAGLIAWFWWWVFRVLLYPGAIDALRIDGPAVTVPAYASFVYEHWRALTVFGTLLTAFPLCILIIRQVWRAANGTSVRESATSYPWRKILAILLACVLGFVAIGTTKSIGWWNTTRAPQPPVNFPSGAHIGTNDGSVFAVHDKTKLHYVIYYPGSFSTSSGGSQNRHSLTWLEEGTIKLRNGRTFGYYRESTGPESLRVNGQDFDLRQGQVFVLHEDGLVKMLPLFPTYTLASAPAQLSKFIAEGGDGFGPVVERELSANATLTDAFLDIDTGTVSSASREFVDQLRASGMLHDGSPMAVDVRDWMQSSGADLIVRTDHAGEPPSLIQVDGFCSLLGEKVRPEDGLTFDTVTAERLNQFVSIFAANTDRLPADQKFWRHFPKTVSFFQTRDGGSGVLEIVHQEPGRVKVRYKLVTASANSKPALPGVLEAKLAGAKAEVEVKEARFTAGEIDTAEILTARNEVKILEAQLVGDVVLAARLRLSSAKEQLEIATKRVAVGALDSDEYQRIKTAVAVAEAELRDVEAAGGVVAPKAKGMESRGVLEAKLEGAKAKAEVLEARYKAGGIEVDEVLTARNEVKILEAQLAGDMVLVARIRLTAAKEQLEMAARRVAVGVLGSDEYQRIKTAVAVAEAEFREAEAAAQGAKAPR